jgi:hypothetical protein
LHLGKLMVKQPVGLGTGPCFAALPFLLLGMLLTGQVCADEEDSADMSELFADGRHRIDLSYTQAEGFDGDVTFALPAYTYSFNNHFRMTAVTSYVDLDFPANEAFGIPEDIDESGWGDSMIGFQYDPSAQLTSGIWVPDTLGVYGSLVMPTGDKDQGLSGDTWVAELGGGLLLDMPWNFWIIPTTAYRKSFEDGDTAYRMNEAVVGLGFFWLFPFRAWFGIEPYVGWDFERETDISQYKIYAGKAFTNGMAMEVSWGSQDRVEKGAVRDDEILVFNLSWQFGAPPD